MKSFKSVFKSLWVWSISLPLLKHIVKTICKQMNPVFIVGCGHSGTSITLSILGNHPSLYVIPFESSIMYAKRDEDIYLRALLWKWKAFMKGKKRWIEKTPNHVWKIDRIFSIFPNARIILMIRDGRDVVCSLKKRTGKFEESLDRWLNDNLAAKTYWGHPAVKLVKLEDLVKSPETVLAELTESINEEPHLDQMLNYHQKDQVFYNQQKGDHTDHTSLRDWQLKQPLFKDTSRWRKDMTEPELDLFMNKAGGLLKELQYD